MKILQTIHQFFPAHQAGTEVAARDAGLELLRRGHEMHVLTTDPGTPSTSGQIEVEDYDYRGLQVHALHLPRTGGVEGLRAEYRNDEVGAWVRKFSAELAPDVVHMFHIGKLTGTSLDALRDLDVPLVFTSTDFWAFCTRGILMKHSGELCSGPDDISSNCLECRRIERWVGAEVPEAPAKRQRFYRRLAERALSSDGEDDSTTPRIRTVLGRTDYLRRRFERVDAILAPTELMRDLLVANGLPEDLVRVSPYSIDLSQFEAVRSQREPATNGVRFGYVGTIAEPKGVHYMLEAFRRLDSGVTATLEVIGDVRRRPDYFQRLNELAAGDPRIRFVGPVPNENVPERLKTIDAQIVPSTWYENAPLTIYTAQAAGVPVLASNLGGMAEVVTHRENGLLFEPGDVEGLARQLRIVAQEPSLIRRMSENARQPRSVVDGVDELLGIYAEIAERKAARVAPPAAAAVKQPGERTEASPQPGESPPGARGGKRRVGLVPRARRREEGESGSTQTDPRRIEVFFVVGRAKSGTTWLMRTLNNHPEILCRGEGRFFGRDYALPGDETPTIPARPLAGALASNEALRSWLDRSVWTRHGDTDAQLAEATRLLTDHFLASAVASSGHRFVGDKTPFLDVNTIAEIAAIHSDAKVLHIVRDGRDVAISAKHHIWNRSTDAGGIHALSSAEIAIRDAYREDPEAFRDAGRSIFTPEWLAGTATEWAEMMRAARAQGRELLGERYHELRYEDMQRDAEAAVAEVLDFLGAQTSPDLLRACVEQASFERAAGGRQRGEENPTEFLRKGVAGEWLGVFTPQDREAFAEAAGDVLVELGYER